MRCRFLKYRKSFTLIEVLVTSAITAFILAGIGTFLTVTFRFNNLINYQTRAHSVLAHTGREIELAIKRGSKIYFYNQDMTLLPDSAFQEISIYKVDGSGNEVFYKGFSFKEVAGQIKLFKVNSVGANINELIAYTETDFKESIFFKEPNNNKFLAFDLTIDLVSGNKKLFSSDKLYFYSKCRN